MHFSTIECEDSAKKYTEMVIQLTGYEEMPPLEPTSLKHNTITTDQPQYNDSCSFPTPKISTSSPSTLSLSQANSRNHYPSSGCSQIRSRVASLPHCGTSFPPSGNHPRSLEGHFITAKGVCCPYYAATNRNNCTPTPNPACSLVTPGSSSTQAPVSKPTNDEVVHKETGRPQNHARAPVAPLNSSLQCQTHNQTKGLKLIIPSNATPCGLNTSMSEQLMLEQTNTHLTPKAPSLGSVPEATTGCLRSTKMEGVTTILISSDAQATKPITFPETNTAPNKRLKTASNNAQLHSHKESLHAKRKEEQPKKYTSHELCKLAPKGTVIHGSKDENPYIPRNRKDESSKEMFRRIKGMDKQAPWEYQDEAKQLVLEHKKTNQGSSEISNEKVKLTPPCKEIEHRNRTHLTDKTTRSYPFIEVNPETEKNVSKDKPHKVYQAIPHCGLTKLQSERRILRTVLETLRKKQEPTKHTQEEAHITASIARIDTQIKEMMAMEAKSPPFKPLADRIARINQFPSDMVSIFRDTSNGRSRSKQSRSDSREVVKPVDHVRARASKPLEKPSSQAAGATSAEQYGFKKKDELPHTDSPLLLRSDFDISTPRKHGTSLPAICIHPPPESGNDASKLRQRDASFDECIRSSLELNHGTSKLSQDTTLLDRAVRPPLSPKHPGYLEQNPLRIQRSTSEADLSTPKNDSKGTKGDMCADGEEVIIPLLNSEPLLDRSKELAPHQASLEPQLELEPVLEPGTANEQPSSLSIQRIEPPKGPFPNTPETLDTEKHMEKRNRSSAGCNKPSMSMPQPTLNQKQHITWQMEHSQGSTFWKKLKVNNPDWETPEYIYMKYPLNIEVTDVKLEPEPRQLPKLSTEQSEPTPSDIGKLLIGPRENCIPNDIPEQNNGLDSSVAKRADKEEIDLWPRITVVRDFMPVEPITNIDDSFSSLSPLSHSLGLGFETDHKLKQTLDHSQEGKRAKSQLSLGYSLVYNPSAPESLEIPDAREGDIEEECIKDKKKLFDFAGIPVISHESTSESKDDDDWVKVYENQGEEWQVVEGMV